MYVMYVYVCYTVYIKCRYVLYVRYVCICMLYCVYQM